MGRAVMLGQGRAGGAAGSHGVCTRLMLDGAGRHLPASPHVMEPACCTHELASPHPRPPTPHGPPPSPHAPILRQAAHHG